MTRPLAILAAAVLVAVAVLLALGFWKGARAEGWSQTPRFTAPVGLAGVQPLPLRPVAPDQSTTAAIVPTASGGIGTVLLGGWASWYDTSGSGYYAAAGPLLRSVLGPDWRGQAVTVTAGSRSVAIVLGDFCACGLRHGKETLLDLSRDAFSQLADPSVGIVAVSIEIGGPEPPRTDTDLRMFEEARDDGAYR